MSESNSKNENNSLAHISVFEQRAYIKINTICCKTATEIHAALYEVCEMDTMDHSLIQR